MKARAKCRALTPACSARSSTVKAAPRCSRKLADLTKFVLKGDVWRRTDLSARDRSLATVAALTAAGETGAPAGEVRRGLAGGLTRDEIVESVTHIAFYAGWPRAQAALPVLEAAFATAK